MKKFIALMLVVTSGLMVGCGAEETVEDVVAAVETEVEVEAVEASEEVETEVEKDQEGDRPEGERPEGEKPEGDRPEGDVMEMPDISEVLEQYVTDGVLTEDEAAALVDYFADFDPMTAEEGASPFDTAVEDGVITQEQADTIMETFQMQGGKGEMPPGGEGAEKPAAE